ncbi:MAG: 50S ribosomal protein L21 [Actinomycetota bacterium]
MYAVVRTGGKQHKVKVGDLIEVEHLGGKPGDKVSLQPLAFVDDESKVTTGHDVLKAITVSATIVEETKGPKLEVFKYQNKTGYHRHRGHRQQLMKIRIDRIEGPGAAGAAAE